MNQTHFLLIIPMICLAATRLLHGAGGIESDASPGDPRNTEQLLQQPGFQATEFIFTTAPFPSCHASTIVETSSGLVAAWFGGTYERHPDVGIWVSRHENGRWTPPREVATGMQASGERLPTWNPVLFQPHVGPLLLFYKVGPNPREWWGMVMTSADAGRTWSAAKRLPAGLLGPIKNKPVQLADGTIISPSSSEDHGWRLHMERSEDGGKTWTATPPLNDPAKIRAIQPSLLIHPHNRLQAVGRTRSSGIFEVWSEDAGRTWGEVTATGLPNPSSGTDAVTLADGRHLLVYNHNAEYRERTPLNVAVSTDGKAWLAALVLEEAPGEFSYPAVIQASDGLVHIVYTWKRERIRHAIIDPNALELSPLIDGRWPRPAGETDVDSQ